MSAIATQNRGSATLVGFTAILMWALLAFLTARSGAMPPFLLAGVTFALGTLVGVAWLGLQRTSAAELSAMLRQPPAVWLAGVGGLFGYHALYFAALRNAPAAEASLVAYLWPLFIVLGSAALPSERLRLHHLAGAVLALGGAAIILGSGGGRSGFSMDHALGYALAFGCALTWSGYSLLSRRFANVPSGVVVGFCAATAVLSFAAHAVFETTVWPTQASQWLAVAALGLLPVGAAFYVWDIGMKRGDVQLLGAASYAAPLLSTLVLVLAGAAEPTPTLLLAALLITLGAGLAALPMFREVLARRMTARRPDRSAG